MKYAILRLNGKQYKVEEGKEFVIDSLGGSEPNPEVLLMVNDKSVVVGKPLVEKAKIGLTTLAATEKAKKITVLKYKAKSRYRKKQGFRATVTRLRVDSIK